MIATALVHIRTQPKYRRRILDSRQRLEKPVRAPLNHQKHLIAFVRGLLNHVKLELFTEKKDIFFCACIYFIYLLVNVNHQIECVHLIFKKKKFNSE